MQRRSNIDRYTEKFTDTLGYGVGDLVSYTPTSNKVMGIVIDIDGAIRKIFVDWGGCGSIHQHNPDELQIVPIQDKSVLNRMANIKIKRVANGIIGEVKTSEFLTQETSNLLNLQFANELSNSALYKVFASWFENQGFPGFRKFFEKQSEDEASHAMKVYEFLVDCGIQVKFPVMNDVVIPSSLKDIVKAALIKETETTKNWQIITESAKKGHNAATEELCQWFMKEQMEEESSVGILYSKVVRAVDNASLEVIDETLLDDEDEEVSQPCCFNRR